jgi:hypothetical protein
MRHAVLLGILCVFALGEAGFAQQPQPSKRRASPEGSSATELGGYYHERLGYVEGKWIEIKYGRPIKRSRDLFGPDDWIDALNDAAPVWRAGANYSTQLFNEMPIEIGGTRIAPGAYTVFIELARDKWTLIISNWKAQTQGYQVNNPDALFGAFEYTPDKDVVRTTMTLETLPFSYDQLHWQFLDVSSAGGRLAIFWDMKMASVPFKVVK